MNFIVWHYVLKIIYQIKINDVQALESHSGYDNDEENLSQLSSEYFHVTIMYSP